MTVDSSATDAGRVHDNLPTVRDFSMLLPFIYDTSSFSDRQVQVANAGTIVASTVVKGQAPAPTHPSTNATDPTVGKKGDKAIDK